MNDRPGVIQVTSETTRGALVVRIRGEVDMRTAPRFRSLLNDYAQRAAGPVLLDLAGVTYMDSSGVGTLVSVKRELERTGRRFVLMNLQGRVRSVLEITHLDRFFRIAANLDEALSA